MDEMSFEIADAHVHMGYYTRAGYDEPFYYSPRRVVGLLSRCGIGEFIVSTTNSQVAEISLHDILREAREMKRVSGTLAHQLLWISGRILDDDPSLQALDAESSCHKPDSVASKLYEGVKLHGVETPWLANRRNDLRRVLDAVVERGMIVQLHTGVDACCHPHEWGKVAQAYPMVRMDFAHCRPVAATLEVMRSCPNAFTDISFLQREEVAEMLASDVADRVMFGSDFPACHAQAKQPWTRAYRAKPAEFSDGTMAKMAYAFRRFVGGDPVASDCSRGRTAQRFSAKPCEHLRTSSRQAQPSAIA